MNIALWIVQLVLALMFAIAGIIKISQPLDKLVKKGNWTDRFPNTFVRFIGIAELLFSIGLILPWALNVVIVLTPIAASGLFTIQFFAIFHHAKYKEWKTSGFNLFLLCLALFVACGRFTF